VEGVDSVDHGFNSGENAGSADIVEESPSVVDGDFTNAVFADVKVNNISNTSDNGNWVSSSGSGALSDELFNINTTSQSLFSSTSFGKENFSG
jgi:hypothetical protein